MQRGAIKSAVKLLRAPAVCYSEGHPVGGRVVGD